jgi:MerR HTH family regulatory protein
VAPDDALVRRLARSSGLRTDEVRRLVRLEVVTLGGETVPPALLRRLRRVRRLCRDLGLSLDAAIIVVRLLDRIEALEGARLGPGRVRVMDDPPQ